VKTQEVLVVVAAGAIAYLVLRPKAVAQVANTGTQTGQGVAGQTNAQSSQPATSSTAGSVLGGLGGLVSGIGGLFSSKGGTDAKSTGTGGVGSSLGNQPVGSSLWSSSFDYRVDNNSKLDSSVLDMDIGKSWATDTDWDAKTNSFDVPDYGSSYANGETGAATGEKLGFDIDDLSLDTSWFN
jgi:hypothetical protein